MGRCHDGTLPGGQVCAAHAAQGTTSHILFLILLGTTLNESLSSFNTFKHGRFGSSHALLKVGSSYRLRRNPAACHPAYAFDDTCFSLLAPLRIADVSFVPLHFCFLSFPAVDFFPDRQSFHDAFRVQRAFNQPGHSPLMTSCVLTSRYLQQSRVPWLP